MINNHRDSFCPAFPNPSQCGCPMKAATYSFKNVGVAIPDFGEIFINILKVTIEILSFYSPALLKGSFN